MTVITRERDIKLEVISYGCRRKAKEKKTDNEQMTGKKKIKSWKTKNIYGKPVNIEKIWKKEKRRTRKCVSKEKN